MYYVFRNVELDTLINNPTTAIDVDGNLPVFLIWAGKGAIGAFIDASAQITVSMANGKGFGEALSNLDLTSVCSSFITSAIAAPGMSTGAKVATGALIASDAVIDITAIEIQSTGGIIGKEKSLSNTVLDVTTSILPGKVVDNATATFTDAIRQDLSSNASATLTKGTKKAMQKAADIVNSEGFIIGANAVVDYSGGILGGAINNVIGKERNKPNLSNYKMDFTQPVDALRINKINPNLEIHKYECQKKKE